ncbi:hypothetical protein [Methanobacterium sp.]|uniref:hypothetical protein n=1 Tax=Methanobacterium sp. TaxID=2164 RepID=UPI003C72515D
MYFKLDLIKAQQKTSPINSTLFFKESLIYVIISGLDSMTWLSSMGFPVDAPPTLGVESSGL